MIRPRMPTTGEALHFQHALDCPHLAEQAGGALRDCTCGLWELRSYVARITGEARILFEAAVHGAASAQPEAAQGETPVWLTLRDEFGATAVAEACAAVCESRARDACRLTEKGEARKCASAIRDGFWRSHLSPNAPAFVPAPAASAAPEGAEGGDK